VDVTLALVADAANVSNDGKLNVLGAFDQISARQFPAIHPAMSLVVRFAASPAEWGQTKQITIVLLDDDGARLATLSSQILVEERADARQAKNYVNVINLRNVQFPHAGQYAFEVMVGGEPKSRVPLLLVQIDPNKDSDAEQQQGEVQ